MQKCHQITLMDVFHEGRLTQQHGGDASSLPVADMQHISTESLSKWKFWILKAISCPQENVKKKKKNTDVQTQLQQLHFQAH